MLIDVLRRSDVRVAYHVAGRPPAHCPRSAVADTGHARRTAVDTTASTRTERRIGRGWDGGPAHGWRAEMQLLVCGRVAPWEREFCAITVRLLSIAMPAIGGAEVQDVVLGASMR